MGLRRSVGAWFWRSRVCPFTRGSSLSQLSFYYAPLMLAWLVCLFSMRLVRREVIRRKPCVGGGDGERRITVADEMAEEDGMGAAMVLLVQQMVRYVIVFVFFYAFGLLNRTVHFVISEVDWCARSR